MQQDEQHGLEVARVLLEIGFVFDAEQEVERVLQLSPDSLDALGLFAKIKHVRGQLSQAITCWTQLYARSPTIGTVLLQLRAILNLAMDPERSAVELLAVGRHPDNVPATTIMELEEAFSALVQRRTREARARCEAIAARQKNSNSTAYRLAVLAHAWIAELSGDLDGATSILERLGEERAFARDVERVSALERVYERIGTPAKLEAAANICRYLHREFDSVSALGRLVVLCERLGRVEEAKVEGARYARAFRRRMNRPSLDEMIHVGAKRYLPLERLVAVNLPPAQAEVRGIREQALRDVIRGDGIGARGGFARGGSLLDDKYLADLDLLEGNLEGAVERYLSVLEQEPDDVLILVRALQEQGRLSGSRARALFADGPIFEKARSALEAALDQSPMRPSLWKALSTLVGLRSGLAVEARALRQRARAQAEASERRRSPIGRVLSPAIYQFMGRQKGLVHELWAERTVSPTGRGGGLPWENILGNLSEELRRGVQSVFLSVREYARAKFPHLTPDLEDYVYHFKMTKEDEHSHGLSAGLPIALAFLSVFLRRSVPQDIAATGMLVTDAHDVLSVRAIGHVEQKIKGAYNRNLRTILIPSENQAEVAASRWIPSAVSEDIVSYVRELDDAVRIVFGPDIFVETGARPWTTRPSAMS